MPSSEEDYRHFVVGAAATNQNYWFNGGYGDGYRYDEKSLARINALLSEINFIAKTGRVIFDPKIRTKRIEDTYLEQGVNPPDQKVKAPVLTLVK